MEVLTKSVIDFFDEQGIELYQTSLVSKSEGLIGDLEEIDPDYVTVQPKEDENDGIVDSPRMDSPHIQGIAKGVIKLIQTLSNPSRSNSKSRR